MRSIRFPFFRCVYCGFISIAHPFLINASVSANSFASFSESLFSFALPSGVEMSIVYDMLLEETSKGNSFVLFILVFGALKALVLSAPFIVLRHAVSDRQHIAILPMEHNSISEIKICFIYLAFVPPDSRKKAVKNNNGVGTYCSILESGFSHCLRNG